MIASVVAFALASSDEAALSNLLQFDALQTPGTPVAPSNPASPASPANPASPSSPANPVQSPANPAFTPSFLPSVAASSVTITFCLVNCNSNLAAVIAAINALVGASLASGSCGSSTCTSRQARSLLQTGNTATITLTGATSAQAQLLQNNIAAGNLLYVGVPVGTTVVAFAPGNVPITLNAVTPVPLSPTNPSPANPVSLCSATASSTITRLPAQSTLVGCTSQLVSVTAANISPAFCCATGSGYQLVANAPVATVCRNLPARTAGCGKRSKKGLLGLLGLLGLIPLCLLLLICCLCCIRRKRRGQAMLFSVTNTPAPLPVPIQAPIPHLHASAVPVGGPGFGGPFQP